MSISWPCIRIWDWSVEVNYWDGSLNRKNPFLFLLILSGSVSRNPNTQHWFCEGCPSSRRSLKHFGEIKCPAFQNAESLHFFCVTSTLWGIMVFPDLDFSKFGLTDKLTPDLIRFQKPSHRCIVPVGICLSTYLRSYSCCRNIVRTPCGVTAYGRLR